MVVRSLLTFLGFDVDTRGMQRYDNGLKNVMKTTIKFAAVTGIAIAALGTAFFKGAGEIEQIEVAFETMLGSVEKAKSLLADITQLAEKTPFQLMEIVKGSKQLLAFGIAGDKIVETMINLGNISAGIGRDKLGTLVRAFGKIRTKGRASMEELNMMLEAGVPILDEIAKKMDMKVGPALFNLVEKGLVSFDIVNESIKDLSNGTGRFADLMIKQSKTLLGMISNIKDVFTNLTNAIGKDLLPDGKRLARLFLDWITLNKEMIRINVVKFYQKLLKAVQNIIAFFEKFKIIGNIGDLLRFLMSVVRIFGDVINRVFTKDGEGVINFLARWVNENKKLIASKIVGFVLKVADGFEKFLHVVKEIWPFLLGFIGTFMAFNGILKGIAIAKALTNPLFLTVAAIGLVAGAILLIAKNWKVVKEEFEDAWHKIKAIFNNIKDIVTTVVSDAISDLIFLNTWLFDTFMAIGAAIKKVFFDAFARIQEILTDLGSMIKKIFDGIFGENAFDKSLQKVKDLIALAQELIDKFDILGGIKKVGKTISNNLGLEEYDPLDPVNKIAGLGATPTVVQQTIKVDAVVNVPAGTPADQLKVVEDGANEIFTTVAATRRGVAALAAFEGID